MQGGRNRLWNLRRKKRPGEAGIGFYESVTKQDLLDPRTLLVYGMNGRTLPVEHGFPFRVLIPNRYGTKQPKMGYPTFSVNL